MSARQFFEGLPLGRARAIAIDVPWRFKSNSIARPGRNAMRHYKCMSLAEIAALPVGGLAADDCWLLFWITAPFLAIGAHIPIFKAWDFRVSTVGFTWLKTTGNGTPAMRPGHATRIDTEFVVIGRRGKPKRHCRSVKAAIVAPAREHSRKPDEFYARADALVGRVTRYDVFARERRPGWLAWGDEVGLFDGGEIGCDTRPRAEPRRMAA
jgi:N6-adenosine-specific RNA methylase IME4